ncbi:MAG: N-acetyltransferase [Planctomycetota bacterium]
MLASASDWLRGQGMTDVRGPTNPSLNYECGMLVDGFDTPPTFMITHNPRYYERLWTEFGFEKTQDLYCYEVDVGMLETLDPKVKFVIDEATRRFKVTCRALDSKQFSTDVRTFLDIYNQSLQGTWGYVPMSNEEMQQMAKGLKYLIVPQMTSIAEIDGKPIGAGFGLLDFNPLIRKMRGRLFPFGWWYLLTQKKRLNRVRLISTNVLMEYQRWGLGLVTLARILPDALDWGIQEGELSWVLESNSLSRKTIERGGGKKFKTHRLFDKTL